MSVAPHSMRGLACPTASVSDMDGERGLGVHHGQPLSRRDVYRSDGRIVRRVYQHRVSNGSQHVADFGKTRLVYIERHEAIDPAIAREKLVKKWRRE